MGLHARGGVKGGGMRGRNDGARGAETEGARKNERRRGGNELGRTVRCDEEASRASRVDGL